MSFASSRLAKSQAPRPSGRRSCLSAWRPLLEQMEDRVVLTAAVNQQTVIQLYQDLLHRLPDAGGLSYWVAQLDAGADTKAVATALAHSNEFHRGEVDGVYQRLLGRAADAGGMTFFASALDAGQAVPQVEAAIASSPEYAQAHGASGFLDALFNGSDHLKTLVSGAYQQVLHRAGDAAGLAYWAGRLAAGESLDDVTASLASSAERAAMPAPTSAVLGTFGDASALPIGTVGSWETSQGGSVNAALGASARGSGTGAAPLGVGTQAVTLKNGLPAVFQAFGPERLVDTRNATAGQYGGPAFTAGGTRTINVAPYNLADPSIPNAATGDQAPTSNLPAKVVAVSVILFIVNAPQPEYVTGYATGTSPAPIGTASVFADHAGQIIAASAIVPVNASGNIDIYSSGGGDLIVDVNGYFLDALDGTDNLPISGSVPSNGVVVGTNASSSAGANGVTGVISSTTPGSGATGVFGFSPATGTVGIGVFGQQNGAGWGVHGKVLGSGIGGNFLAGTGGTGVKGAASGVGSIGGNFSGETGVNVAAGTTTGIFVGNATTYGVQASGTTSGGFFTGGSGGIGVQGTAFGGGSIGVLGRNAPGGYGVFATGDLGASGAKNFVDPSPSDPSKQIAYVSLEGREAGTYFRGTGHFVNGTATLDVPQDFRDVTDPNGLSVQVTPVGPTFTSVTVKSIDLSHVVVMGSQDVDFFYTVNGVRKGYQGYNPIQSNFIYVPHSATDTLPTWLSETQKQTLIANGTYHADGTVNLATAHNLGWDQLWTTTAGASTSAA